MADQRILRLRFSGLVQGVGFRAFVQREAAARGLSGWVRNRRDRTVEAVVAGPAAIVEAFVAVCRRGPAGGRVDSVAIEPAEAAGLGVNGAGSASFEVLPSD